MCSGDGNPVRQNGWLRLRMIQGAGDTVPAKRGKIGVKNHGLKTAFAIGNELRLMSDGLAITQTLFARGPNEPPYPGASDFPIRDPEAPSKGCQISVPYRTSAVRPPHGEAIELAAISSTDIDDIFLAACKNAPEQFAGIVSPESIPREILSSRSFLADRRTRQAKETRILFWRWLRRNRHAVPRRDRPKLADLAIWPDHVGRPRRLGDLCDPRSRLAAKALADSIVRPHEQVRRSGLVSFSTRARLSIRRIPMRWRIPRESKSESKWRVELASRDAAT